jgi:NitT/TauT family transport system substrate-binding protein
MCWGARADVPLTGPRSLEGRRVAISQSSTFFQLWDAFAKRFGVDKSKVDVVSADPSARIGLLLGGRVDVIADLFIANEIPLLQERLGSKLNLWRLSQADFDPLGYLVVASTSAIQRDPGLIKAFTGATLRGMQYTAEHPDDAAAIVSRTNDNLPATVYRGQVAELVTLMNLRPAPGKNVPAAWSHSLDILRSAGLIQHALDHDAYYTNAFV